MNWSKSLARVATSRSWSSLIRASSKRMALIRWTANRSRSKDPSNERKNCRTSPSSFAATSVAATSVAATSVAATSLAARSARREHGISRSPGLAFRNRLFTVGSADGRGARWRALKDRTKQKHGRAPRVRRPLNRSDHPWSYGGFGL